MIQNENYIFMKGFKPNNIVSINTDKQSDPFSLYPIMDYKEDPSLFKEFMVEKDRSVSDLVSLLPFMDYIDDPSLLKELMI